MVGVAGILAQVLAPTGQILMHNSTGIPFVNNTEYPILQFFNKFTH